MFFSKIVVYYNLYYMMNDFEAFYIWSRNQNETGCGSFFVRT